MFMAGSEKQGRNPYRKGGYEKGGCDPETPGIWLQHSFYKA
jgi:hypothetical protein